MEQRRLRLGDILDDYCPRERRITNHAVVAMIDDDVKQTRCTTCDADHEYKQGKTPAPRRRKPGALFQDMPEGARPRAVTPLPLAADAVPPPDAGDEFLPQDDFSPDVQPELAAASDADTASAADIDEPEPAQQPDDDGPVHRRLIRATLPRPEGHVPERKEPDFTMRQPTGRDFNGDRPGQRGRGHRPMRPGQGEQGNTRWGGGGQRQGTGGAPRHGSGAPHGQGQRQGNRPGQPSQNRGGARPAGQNRGPGRKRGR
jgi:translation initiation factor IF-2